MMSRAAITRPAMPSLPRKFAFHDIHATIFSEATGADESPLVGKLGVSRATRLTSQRCSRPISNGQKPTLMCHRPQAFRRRLLLL